MVKVELIKDADGVVMTLDGEYEVVFSLAAFDAFAERISEISEKPVNHAASWYFDPLDDVDDEPEVGYSERDPLAMEDDE